MKLIITERWVLRKISERRNFIARNDNRLDEEAATKALTYRKVRGVERNVFIDYLINDFNHISVWKFRLHPITKWFRRIDATKSGKLIIRVNDVIDQALNDGYLYPLDHCQDEDFDRLKLTKKGYKYISRLYWIRSFYNNNHVQTAISTLITWGMPLLALYILSHFFNISLTPKI